VENVTTGDRVRKGQPLLQLYSPDINSAAAQLISNPGFDGSRRRLRNLNLSDEAIAEMERTRKVPQAIRWYAPQDGFVRERNVVDGMKAAAGDVLFRIADISTMWVLADVPEYELGTVKPDQNGRAGEQDNAGALAPANDRSGWKDVARRLVRVARLASECRLIDRH
jgi:Cu(I)/Ag(I) efflux system membrane fusion protein